MTGGALTRARFAPTGLSQGERNSEVLLCGLFVVCTEVSVGPGLVLPPHALPIPERARRGACAPRALRPRARPPGLLRVTRRDQPSRPAGLRLDRLQRAPRHALRP